MENWLNRYGKYLNYSALEIELDIPGGTLVEAQMNEAGIPKEWKPKIEGFIEDMHQALAEQE